MAQGQEYDPFNDQGAQDPYPWPPDEPQGGAGNWPNPQPSVTLDPTAPTDSSTHAQGSSAPNPYTQTAQAQQNPAPAAQAAMSNPYGDPADYYGSRGRAVAGWYQRYLGRQYDENGYRGYVNGNMTLQQIEDAIRNSPEARQFASGGASGAGAGGASTGGLPPLTGPTMDDAVIAAYVQSFASLPGVDPSIVRDPAYWIGKIKEKGGLSPTNLEYWKWMAVNNQHQPAVGSVGAGAGAGTGGFQGPMSAQIEAAILQLLKEGNSPIDPNSPEMQAQFIPMRNVLERNAQMGRAEAAQRAAYTGQSVGGGGGSLEGDYASINEGLGQREGQLMSQVVTNELQARRQKVVNALQFAQGQQQIALQAYLAELNRQIQIRQLEYQQAHDEYAFNQSFQQGLQ